MISVPERGACYLFEGMPMLAQNWASSDRNRVRKFGTRLTQLGQVCPGSTKSWPKSADLAPSSTNLGELRTGIGQIWPEIDQTRPKLARNRPRLARILPNLARIRATLARTPTKSSSCGTALADIGSNSTTFDQEWHRLSGQIWPTLTKLGPSSVKLGPESTNFDQARFEVDQLWPGFGFAPPGEAERQFSWDA